MLRQIFASALFLLSNFVVFAQDKDISWELQGIALNVPNELEVMHNAENEFLCQAPAFALALLEDRTLDGHELDHLDDKWRKGLQLMQKNEKVKKDFKTTKEFKVHHLEMRIVEYLPTDIDPKSKLTQRFMEMWIKNKKTNTPLRLRIVYEEPTFRDKMLAIAMSIFPI